MAATKQRFLARLAHTYGVLRLRAGMATRALRRRPRLLIGVAAALVVAAGAAAAMTFGWADDLVDSVQEAVSLKPPTMEELVARVKANPKDAEAHLQLGHAHFAAGSKPRAFKAYAKALGLDAKAADGKLVDNLVGCFGTAHQGAAADMLAKYKVNAADGELLALTKSKSYTTRREAVDTLEKLGRAGKIDYRTVFELDLQVGDCDIRRRAVDKLGKVGDRGSIAALRAARKKDEEETPWYRSSCLGKAPEEAEKKIASRK